ncbi:hypothetical protein [Pacificibacter marinus]|uniref:Type I-E CRISPR-associated protein Cse1/CasA n=1 Tax=Pacificibacter marinus TaxID=658057 RepID=A0A1Y5TRR0_9RHOB|nr:hypothetical protein [Pacificibacter marinus]SEL39303.1 hypothetical protein SAMN04488032_1244 [Pacificibacter marinus]SLN70424.1 hypothetical protein PAM7971_03777 [Pacificibacter marinus]
MFEIVDEEGSRSWLSQQDRQTRIWFVARMALRSFPAAIGDAPFDERNTLRLLHHLLISTVGSIDLRAAKNSAKLAFGTVGYKGSAQQIHNDQLLLASPYPSQGKVLYGDQQPSKNSIRTESGENVIGNAITWAIEIGEPQRDVGFGGGYWELAWLAGSKHASKLATADVASPREWPPLWGAGRRPAYILDDYTNLNELFDSDPSVWGFWQRWFEAIHDGVPLPWELSRLVALTLSDQDWQSGAAHVAREIEKIEALFAVRQSLSDLATDRAETAADNRLGIGGNNPPVEFEWPTAVQRSHTIAWTAVDEIEQQTQAKKPDKSLIKAALEKLIQALRICLRWAGKKADLAVDETIKWGIRATGGYFLLNSIKFQALIEAVKNWIAILP